MVAGRAPRPKRRGAREWLEGRRVVEEIRNTPVVIFLLNDRRIDDGLGGGGIAGIRIDQIDVIAVIRQ